MFVFARNIKGLSGSTFVTDPVQPSRKLQYPELPPNILSIQHQKIVQAMGQFIVMLGLSPYLLSGVGMPLKQRTHLMPLQQ